MTLTKRRILAMATAPALAGLLVAAPAYAHATTATHHQSVPASAVQRVPLTAMTLTDVRKAYADFLSHKTAKLPFLTAKVSAFVASVGGAPGLSPAQHAQAVAWTEHLADLRAALMRVPTTGRVAASPDQLAAIDALKASIDSLQARLAPVAALPVTVAAAVVTTPEVTPDVVVNDNDGADTTEAADHNGLCDHFGGYRGDHGGHDHG